MPVYSSVWHGNLNDRGKPENALLSVMLSVRNTDPRHDMIITSVRYHDSSGRLLRDYLEQPRALTRLSSQGFFVENREAQGGAGASFVVSWQAEQPINAPIMESVHVYHWGTQAQAFTSRGQVIHSEKSASQP
ncbi:MAG: DUF3124 domain-containing protein [Magnetococcales bacterium]|nr:DUF3124 domain-containing protein [Magnetococcales bacterium]